MTRILTNFLVFTAVCSFSSTVVAYTVPSSSVCQHEPLAHPHSKVTPNTFHGLSVEVPDLEQTFASIGRLSPLARGAMEGMASEFDDTALKWKTIESRKSGSVQHIERLDNKFAPMLRFRSSFQGLSISEFLDRYLVAMEQLLRTNDCIDKVELIHSIQDADVFRRPADQYGECTQTGIVYGKTKSAFGISPRETMFLYGTNEFPDGSLVIWGKEMAETYNHLLPPCQRHTRAKMHLFAVTLKPSTSNAFDVEYVVHLDCGGRVPNWATTPMLIDTIKGFFETAQKECADASLARIRVKQENAAEHLVEQASAKQESFASSWQTLLVPI